METRRTAWHWFLALHLREHAPRWIEVRDEVPLSVEPQRVDFLLRRRRDDPDPEDRGSTLTALWPMLGRDAVVEFKSLTRPYRTRDLHRLIGYGLQHFVASPERLATERELTLVLMVPARTPSLDADLDALAIAMRATSDGYATARGVFPLVLVEIDRVSERDRDDAIALFGRTRPLPLAARAWYQQHIEREEIPVDARELADFRRMVARVFDAETLAEVLHEVEPDVRQRLIGTIPAQERLAGLDANERLAGLDASERLAGLDPHQMLLALPDDALRALSREYLDALPAPVRDAIQARIAR